MNVIKYFKSIIPDDVKKPFAEYRSRYVVSLALRKARQRDPNFKMPARSSLVFGPDTPTDHISAMWKILRLLNVTPLNAGCEDFQTAIDVLWLHADKLPQNCELRLSVVNRELVDISKPRVDVVAAEVFGYSIVIDPQAHVGKAVRKSETNAAHDGVIVDCPCAPERGYVYQKLVDAVARGFAFEYRLLVCEKLLPAALLKKRPPEDRFRNSNTSVQLVPISALLSTEEIGLIELFVRRIGMKYGELDVLRDNGSGKIYVIDANRTPSGPSRPLPISQMADALILMASGFERLLSGFESHFAKAAEATIESVCRNYRNSGVAPVAD